MTDRDRMLTELTKAMRRHHAGRRFRRRAVVSLATVAIAIGAILVATPGAPESPLPARWAVTIIRNSPRTDLIRTIGDDELLDRLAEIDKPTGMIRTGGRAWLTEPPV